MGERQIALVTGASKGIGAAVARELARDGFDIWLNYRSDHAAAEKVAEEVRALGVSCTLLPFDVGDSAAVQSALEARCNDQPPYVLVNNAGFARDGLFFWMTQSDWQDVLSVHLGGFYHATRLVLPAMLGAKRGRIINMVSTSGQSGMPGQVNYSAAKAGLIGATKALAAEVARKNVLVNAVAPGFIVTDMTAHVDPKLVLPSIPMGRIGTPEEVAGVVSFLASCKASYVTGQVIAVNGGVYR